MQHGSRELVDIRTTGPVQGGVVVTNVVHQDHTHNHAHAHAHDHTHTHGHTHQHGLTAGNQNLGQSLTHDEKADHFEENDLFYSKERRNYVFWTRNLGIIAIILSIASLVLASIHASRYHPNFIILLVTSAALFLISSIAIVLWSSRSANSYKSHTDIFQPRSSDNLTKAVFILGLLLSGLSLFLLTNLYVQDEYSLDFARAANSVSQTWNDRFGEGTTLESAINFFRIDFIVQSCITGFFFFFFLLSSRAAFRCLKWDNQAMSYLVFLGGTLFLIFGLGIIYYANINFRYEDIPALLTRFPLWNLRALFILGIVITVISFVGFLIDHQSWRIGFFVLSFILLITLVLLVNFTGYGYRHSRQIYNYYKSEGETNTCHAKLLNVDESDILGVGCPAKYLAPTCTPTLQVNKWEVANDNGLYCLNYACCGLVGQLYAESYLDLSNWGLLATLAGTIMSIACYYFWYVSWVDTSRDKRKDFFWLGIMGLSIVTFLILFFAVDYNYVTEHQKVKVTGTTTF